MTMNRAREAVKSLRDTAAAVLKPYRWRRGAGGLVIATYHRVLPPDFPGLELVEPGMYVSEETFEAHVKLLSEEFSLMHLSSWLDAVDSGASLPARCAAITFDDGWRDNYEYALPILRRYEAPATVFVVSGMVGTDQRFWPERLAAILGADISTLDAGQDDDAIRWLNGIVDDADIGAAPYSAEAVSRAIQVAKRDPDDVNHRMLDLLEARVPVQGGAAVRDVMNWDELKEMQKDGLVEIGSHTRSHFRLADGADPTRVETEVWDSKKTLEAGLGTDVSLFCYPNGDVSDDSETLVRRAYRAACTTKNGWNERGIDPWSLRRISLHEGNSARPGRFIGRLSGWA